MLESFKRYMTLNESMDVTVVDHHPDPSTDTMSDLCNYLYAKALRPIIPRLQPEEQSAIQYDTFAVDGLEDDFNTTGTINFYVRGLLPQTIKLILAAAKYHLEDIGVQMGQPKQETHGDKMRKDLDQIHKTGDDEYDPEFPEIIPKTAAQRKQEYMDKIGQIDHQQVRVIRIPILGRDRNKQKPNTHPHLNLADASAHHVFGNLLGYPPSRDQHGSGYGPISAHDLYIKIENLLRYEKEKAIQSGGVGGATIIHQGFSEERLDRILNTVAKICRWAIDNGYQEIVVS